MSSNSTPQPHPRLTLGQVAELLGVPAPDQPQRIITGVATLAEAGPDDLSYIGSDAWLKHLDTTRAGAVIAQKRVKLNPDTLPMPILLVEDAEIALARVLERFAPPIPAPPPGIDPSARIADSAILAELVAIGPNVVIGHRSRIGPGVICHPGVVIGDDVTIGAHCQLFPNVVIRERITLGDRVIIHAGSILGTDGFGYRWDGHRHVKVPQIGTIIIEEDVEIGSCVCIDRAKLSTTRIGRGTKIDNLVQIAHNVQVGPHCIIVGQAGLAGSVNLGQGVILGGQSAIRDHITLGEGAMVAACSAVMDDVPPKAIVSGLPAFPHRQSLREQAAIRRLPELVTQVRKLQEEIRNLKKQA